MDKARRAASATSLLELFSARRRLSLAAHASGPNSASASAAKIAASNIGSPKSWARIGTLRTAFRPWRCSACAADRFTYRLELIHAASMRFSTSPLRSSTSPKARTAIVAPKLHSPCARVLRYRNALSRRAGILVSRTAELTHEFVHCRFHFVSTCINNHNSKVARAISIATPAFVRDRPKEV